MQNFKDLRVWQKAMDLVFSVYANTKEFPLEERYGLTPQMQRAAVSIPSNIAEGHMRKTSKDFQQFLAIARGSCAELETQASIAYKLQYLDNDDYLILSEKIQEIAKMLSSFYSKLTSY